VPRCWQRTEAIWELPWKAMIYRSAPHFALQLGRLRVVYKDL
jgi:hypothetical protein